jgi:hypothetical protein
MTISKGSKITRMPVAAFFFLLPHKNWKQLDKNENAAAENRP